MGKIKLLEVDGVMPTPIMQQPCHLEMANFTSALPQLKKKKTLVKTAGMQVLGVGKRVFSTEHGRTVLFSL